MGHAAVAAAVRGGAEQIPANGNQRRGRFSILPAREDVKHTLLTRRVDFINDATAMNEPAAAVPAEHGCTVELAVEGDRRGRGTGAVLPACEGIDHRLRCGVASYGNAGRRSNPRLLSPAATRKHCSGGAGSYSVAADMEAHS